MAIESRAGIAGRPASSSSSAAAATGIEDLHPDVLTQALRRLDGPTLASASCASSHIRSLSSQHDLWRDLCLSTWPSLRQPPLLHLISSFPNSHRSFFSDAYPFPSPCSGPTDGAAARLPTKLISAVDLYYAGSPIVSRAVETDTSTPWFRGSPFRIDGLDRKDPNPAAEQPVVSPDELTLSWIVTDPSGRRAVNVSSRRPVAVERHWYTGETLVRFATVLGGGCALGVVVTCGEETGHVQEVSLTVEDMDGMGMNGRDSLVILKEAMEGERRGSGREAEEAALRRYDENVRRKRWMKERRIQRELMLDLCCSAVGVALLLVSLVLVALR